MSIWKVTVRGTEHTVKFVSPTFGAKTIFVDGKAVASVGSTISMWGNYHFDIEGEPATIKFRAIKSFKGMSLRYNGQTVPPESENSEVSAETVGLIQIGLISLVVLGAAVKILAKSQ